VCNGAETCLAGLCTAGTPLVCDDLNPCTVDTCDPIAGCVFTPNTGLPCEDGLFCTVGDTCAAGACAAGIARDCSAAPRQCNIGVCNEAAAACQGQPTNEGFACFTDACLTGETCQGGSCTGGTPLPPADCFSARFLVAQSGSSTLGVVRTSDKVLEASIPTGEYPVYIGMAGNHGYVTNNVDDSVTVIDLTNYDVLATIPV